MEQVVSGDGLMQRMSLLRAYMGMREAKETDSPEYLQAGWGGDFLHLLEGSCAEDQIESNVLYPWLGMKQ